MWGGAHGGSGFFEERGPNEKKKKNNNKKKTKNKKISSDLYPRKNISRYNSNTHKEEIHATNSTGV